MCLSEFIEDELLFDSVQFMYSIEANCIANCILYMIF